ncbi:hypothetical protein BAE44_0016681 [Dichanthelium oligosanthes]|uniref:F-box/LRR-repeat protein n=1 Tax=Dichanthelium oligosanthes TaxID=888268 RepID=A0A1E5VAW7_9POAL|nr:hypothetical protein BAE44_0016681 [Dichanthelium oligosanthes]
MEAVKERRRFGDRLLRLRGHAPLETCDLRFRNFYDDDDALLLNRWVWHVVACRVRTFRLHKLSFDGFQLDDTPLVSQHLLTRLDLIGVHLKTRLCAFSSCPSLEHLEIDTCYWWDDINISSESLKHHILYCDLSSQFRSLIHVPSLVSLTLDDHLSRAPVLGCMPSLQKAFVRVTHDNIPDGYSWGCDYEDCYSCSGIVHDNSSSMCALLEGLSEAENLALIAESKFVFEKDLKQCPTFSKLKTLVLDDSWCVSPEFSALTCILKHSPVLEKLTLQLFLLQGPQHKIEMIGRCSSMFRSVAVSEHLKAIEIKCQVVDEEIHKVSKFLCSFNICK